MDGLVGFWPLNEEFGGSAFCGGDMTLHGITYFDDSNKWRSPPVRFAGNSDSYLSIDSSHMLLPQSFSWMAAVYLEQGLDGPLFEIYAGECYITS